MFSSPCVLSACSACGVSAWKMRWPQLISSPPTNSRPRANSRKNRLRLVCHEKMWFPEGHFMYVSRKTTKATRQAIEPRSSKKRSSSQRLAICFHGNRKTRYVSAM